jgi:hypothetical protein
MTNENLGYTYDRAEDKSFKVVDHTNPRRKSESLHPLVKQGILCD